MRRIYWFGALIWILVTATGAALVGLSNAMIHHRWGLAAGCFGLAVLFAVWLQKVNRRYVQLHVQRGLALHLKFRHHEERN